MWPFKDSNSRLSNALFKGFTDWHSHLLPGVDDGVQTLEESLNILDSYEKLGISSVWLTPHIMEDIPNATEFLKTRFDELNSAYQGTVKLQLAAEYMLDNLFEERLECNDLLALGKSGNYLLVETSYFNPPMNFYSILDKIKVKGYHPVLAHPERYTYLTEKDYQALKARGVKFQLNLFALANVYPKNVRRKAELLLNNKMYNMIGTDIHSLEYCKYISNLSLTKNQLKILEMIV